MKLDPDVELLLEKMRESGEPSLDQLSIEDARRAYVQNSERLGGPVVDVALVQDVAASGPAGPIPLRLYRPHGLAAHDAPALIYIHGGGWVIGGIESHDKVCRQLADRAGCAVVSIDYRLAPEHPAPAGAVDAIAALQWIAEHADDLGLDRTRLAVGGDSAGGSLSAVTAISARDAGIELRAQILIYPGTDNRATAWQYPSRVHNAGFPPLTRPMMEYFLDKFLPDEAAAENWRVSPLLAASLEGVAPTLVITGGADVLHDEGLLYADRLDDAGVAVIRRNFPGMIHGFIEMSGVLTAAREALSTIAFYLRERFGA